MVSVTQKSKNSFLKEKNLKLKTINIFKKVNKTHKKATKKRKIVVFSNNFCSFLSPPIKGDKKRQKRQLVAFSLCRCPPQHQGDSTILSKIIRKFPHHSLLFFNKFLHLNDAAILCSLLRFTALNEKQLLGVFELFENQILTRSGRVSSAQLDVAFLLARSSVKNRVKDLLKSEITIEEFSDFKKRLAETDLIALEKLSIN